MVAGREASETPLDERQNEVEAADSESEEVELPDHSINQSRGAEQEKVVEENALITSWFPN